MWQKKRHVFKLIRSSWQVNKGIKVNPPRPVLPGTDNEQKQWPACFSDFHSPVTSSGTSRLSALSLSSAAPAGPAAMQPPEIHNKNNNNERKKKKGTWVASKESMSTLFV